MARRRVTSDRAWYYNEGQLVCTNDDDANIQDLMLFSDIEVDTALTRERSEFYIQRMILWFSLTYAASGEAINIDRTIASLRVGQIDPDLWEKDVDEGFVQSPDFVSEDWARIYQEADFSVGTNAPLVRNGAALIVDDSPTGTAVAYPIPPADHVWDLSFKSRLFEEKQIALMLGTRFPGSGKSIICTWRVKFLLQRGR